MGMLSAIRNRRPWVAALIVLFFTPVVGMAYLNRGWLGALYLLLAIAIAAGAFLVSPYVDAAALLTYVQIALAAVALVGLLHALWLAYWYDPSRSLRWVARRWYLVALLLLLAPLGALWGLGTYAYEPFTTTSNSMTPSIGYPDGVLVSHFLRRDFNPQRGDVVMFNGPSGPMVKRVVGMPGESIQMQGGILFINGVLVFLRFMPDTMAPCEDRMCPVPQYEELLPGGHKSPVLNRERLGTSDNTDLYLVPADGYFVLGDDRDNSQDSRHIGPVSRQYLLGRVVARYRIAGHWTWQPVD